MPCRLRPASEADVPSLVELAVARGHAGGSDVQERGQPHGWLDVPAESLAPAAHDVKGLLVVPACRRSGLGTTRLRAVATHLFKINAGAVAPQVVLSGTHRALIAPVPAMPHFR